jgi:uncharacterized protein YaaN involved in tellurite resistance
VQRDEERRRHQHIMADMTSSFETLRRRVSDYHSALRVAMV